MTASMTLILSQDHAEALTQTAIDDLTAAGTTLAHLRETLLQLYEGRAWEALGYPSWPAYCQDRFQRQYAWCYQQVQAAKLERILQLAPGTLPGTAAVALSPIARQPETVKKVYAKAQADHGPNPTGPQVRQAVRAFTPVSKGSQGLKGKGAVGKFAEPDICPTCRRPL